MFWYSRLVKVERDGKGWKATLVTDLHVSPAAVAPDRERLLFLTDDYLSSLEVDGRQRELLRWTYPFHPGTMVRRKDGEVWIGGQQAVVRLTPKSGGEYAAQWFVHS